ncbi:MAG: hypothetical protein AB2A00_25735 [Myxococcota bacterium]
MAHPTRKSPARGFALVLAALLVLVITSVAISAMDVGNASILAEGVRVKKLSAQQVAEMGLARGMREAKRLQETSFEWDFDILLDPDAVSNATGTDGDEYIPPHPAVATASSGSVGGWGSSTETVNGLVYRKVLVDTDSNGTQDGAYLVRYDDNRDDNMSKPSDTTTNHGQVEGPSAGGDVPYRDRDQSVFITSIGLVGGTTYADAEFRHTLRATMRATGGKSVIAGGSPDIGNNTQLCGNGALFCGGASDLTELTCFCGDIRAPSFPGGFGIGSPGPCTGCNECAEQSLTTATCGSTPVPPAPPSVSFTNSLMGNYDGTGPTCHFYIYDNSAAEKVYIWDRINPNCTATSATDVIPTPDTLAGNYATNAENYPQDCWIAVMDSSVANHNFDGSWFKPGYVASLPAGYSAGEVIPIPAEITRRTVGWGLGTGLHIPGSVNWNAYCGCTSCNGAGAPQIYHENDEDLQLFAVGSGPRAIYYVDMVETDHLDVYRGGSGPFQAAVIANFTTPDKVHIKDTNDITMSNPYGCGATNYAIVTNGRIEVDVNQITFNYGIWANQNIVWGGQNGEVGGDVITGGALLAGSTNNFNIFGGCPTPACPGVANIWAGANCEVKNGPNYCANMKCVGQIEFKNNGEIGGTIWAGANVKAGNNTTADPVDPSGSMLGSASDLSSIQSISY